MKKPELARKAIHISSILLPIYYRYVFNYDKKLMILVLSGLTLSTLVIELFRLENKNFHRYFHLLFGVVLRKHESYEFTGATYLLVSAMICVSFFPADIAFASMAFLAIGDTAAALVGMSFGKRKYISNNKTIEGTIACFVSTFIFGLWVFKEYAVLALIGAIAVSIAETVNIRIDDNVKIPIFSGIVMSIAMMVI